MAINFLQALTQPQGMPVDPRFVSDFEQMVGQPVRMDDREARLSTIGGSPATAPVEMPVPRPAARPAAEAAEPPRKRRSFLDTVGQISDVIARVGGAEALYQPTLDAREDRQRSLGLQDMQRQLVEQQIASGEDAAFGRGNERLGMAVKGLQAIQRGGGDIQRAWPLLAQQAGLPEDRAAMLGQIFSSDPNALEGVAAMLGQQDPAEFGLQPFYVQRPDGSLTAYQLGKDGSVREVQLGEGEAPIDPLKFVDLGGTQAGVGTRSGQVRSTLTNTVDPNTQANIGSRERIAAAGNASRERTARIRAATKGNEGNTQQAESIIGRIGDIRGAVERLDQLNALVNPEDSTFGNIIRRARSSGAGQLIEGFVGTEAQEQRDLIVQNANAVVFSMKQALGLTARDLDTNQDVQRALGMINNPNTTKANMLAALDTLEEQFTLMLEKNAGGAAPSQRRRVRPNARPAASRPQGGQSGAGWGKATVVRD